MSLFGFGGGSSGSAASAASTLQMEMATAELDMITDTFNKLVSSCHSKCINAKYHEADLSKGESVCIDRCVAKFFVVNQKVGEKMTALGGAAAGGAAPGGAPAPQQSGSFFGR